MAIHTTAGCRRSTAGGLDAVEGGDLDKHSC
jgi:hypothetical protein